MRFRSARRHIDLISGDIGHPSSLVMTDFLARSLQAQGDIFLFKTTSEWLTLLITGKEDDIRFIASKFLYLWDEFPLNCEWNWRQFFFGRYASNIFIQLS